MKQSFHLQDNLAKAIAIVFVVFSMMIPIAVFIGLRIDWKTYLGFWCFFSVSAINTGSRFYHWNRARARISPGEESLQRVIHRLQGHPSVFVSASLFYFAAGILLVFAPWIPPTKVQLVYICEGVMLAIAVLTQLLLKKVQNKLEKGWGNEG